jgi:small subunit ribosomal protein S9
MADTKLKVKSKKSEKTKVSSKAKASAVKAVVKKPKVSTKEPKSTVTSIADQKPIQFAVGRRKRAVARVRMYKGKGEIIINEQPIASFAPTKASLNNFMEPLNDSAVLEGHMFTIKVLGGGVYGQLGAAKHGIARCISKISDDMRKTMKSGGYLTRDPREKERKKIYHVRARKSPQFSKR